MKKFLIIAMMAVLPSLVSAQRVDKPGEPYYAYCLFSYSAGEVNISLRELYMEYLVDDNNKRIKFASSAEALTYMSKRGWEYVEKTGTGEYLLRKKVTSEEQTMEYLNIKQKKK